MFRKIILAAAAAAVLAGSALTVSVAAAGDRGDAIAGAILGAAGALIGMNASYEPDAAATGYNGKRKRLVRYTECFDKPVTQWRSGELVVVGYREVCY